MHLIIGFKIKTKTEKDSKEKQKGHNYSETFQHSILNIQNYIKSWSAYKRYKYYYKKLAELIFVKHSK